LNELSSAHIEKEERKLAVYQEGAQEEEEEEGEGVSAWRPVVVCDIFWRLNFRIHFQRNFQRGTASQDN